MALAITGGNGDPASQINTQSPQTSAGSGAPAAAPAKNVQPGTASSLLSGAGQGSSGIPLNSTVLPVANLNTSAQTTTQAAKPPQPTQPSHHPNALLVGIVAVLLVAALLTVWQIQRSVKNTTNY